MFYTRVVELDDIGLPSPPTNIREAPRFGQLSFNMEVPLDWDRNRGRKRRLGDGISNDNDSDDYESDDEDLSGLVRVTIVSRRKKIKVFEGPLTGGHSSPTAASFRTLSSETTTTTKSTRVGFLKLLSSLQLEAWLEAEGFIPKFERRLIQSYYGNRDQGDIEFYPWDWKNEGTSNWQVQIARTQRLKSKASNPSSPLFR